MTTQLGVEGTAPITAINEHWEYRGHTFGFKITKVNTAFPYIAEAMCDDGKPLDLTPSFLMRDDVHVSWNDVPPMFIKQHAGMIAASPNHQNARRRAQSVALAYIEMKKDDPEQISKDIIITLDGCGNNRCTFTETFSDLRLPCPRIVTFECDAVVALAQRLVYGSDVIFTGGDPLLRSKKMGTGRQQPLLEHSVLHNRVPADRVVIAYLDYCGGPPSGISMQCVLSKFPNLKVYAATMSRRQHPDVEKRFDTYIPVLYNFGEAAVFLDNPRVVCKLYVSNGEKRRVVVPGHFWDNCPSKLKRARFEGVMVTGDTAAITTERGVELVFMNKKSKASYLC